MMGGRLLCHVPAGREEKSRQPHLSPHCMRLCALQPTHLGWNDIAIQQVSKCMDPGRVCDCDPQWWQRVPCDGIRHTSNVVVAHLRRSAGLWFKVAKRFCLTTMRHTNCCPPPLCLTRNGSTLTVWLLNHRNWLAETLSSPSRSSTCRLMTCAGNDGTPGGAYVRLLAYAS